jgi:CBS domain-containing protein
MDRKIARHFRDQLRQARAATLSDAEGYQHILFVFERLGSHLLTQIRNLGRYGPKIVELAEQSPMASQIPTEAGWHTPFKVKYDIVCEARNAALHQGALARHLTVNAVELSLVLEEAIMSEYDRVRDFMVTNPVCAYLWQPLSFIRQTMLVNSFSYLPVLDEAGTWQLISDFNLASYLRRGIDKMDKEEAKKETKTRLVKTLGQVAASREVKLLPTKTVHEEESIQTALQKSEGLPVVVTSPDPNQLIGILTPFDLL